jgi:hypothetical protein
VTRHGVEPVPHADHHDGILCERVELVAHLILPREKRITMGKPLRDLVVERWRRRPRRRLQDRCQLRERLGVNGVGLRAREERLGDVVRLQGVHATDGVALANELRRQGEPLGARGLHHDERLCRRDPQRA